MKIISKVLIFSLTFLTVAHIEAVTSNKTITSYDPAELIAKIFKPNIGIEPRQRGYGFIKFEDQTDSDIDSDRVSPGQYGLIDNERDPRPLRFEDDYDSQNYDPNIESTYDQQNYNQNRPLTFANSDDSQDLSANNGGQVTFQDDNKVDDQGNKKRKRRRRRKPKNGLPHYPGASGLPLGSPGFQVPGQGGYGLNPYGTGYPSVPYRRPRRPRPRPSLASEALSSVTEALTSIARYDDYQCVPRLLCEAAGGGALSDNGVLQSIAGIQPLLTLLSAYNGISTSPLFVFGRAVFLGMTSKGNTGTCRYAYPQCPTDPEQLIFYLNNHNGGFFRFFNAPQSQNQNLEQFYSQLGQGYGLYQPDQPQQNYGHPNNQNSLQNYGYQQNQNINYPGPYDNQHYGLQSPYDRPGLYNQNNQAYGSNYAYDYNNYGSSNQIKFKDGNARIEKRIQNTPTTSQIFADDSVEDDDVKTKWHFPDSFSENASNNEYNIRDSRTLKFPEETQTYNSHKDSYRKGKELQFPRDQYNQNIYNRQHFNKYNDNRYETTTYSYHKGQNSHNYLNNRPNTYTSYNNFEYTTPNYNNYNNYNKYSNDNYQNNQNYYNKLQNIYSNNEKYPTTTFNNEEYVFDHKHNFYVKKENHNNFKRNEDDGLKTVYVVRGNGDPNKPEIVKLRPGQTLPLY